jgi:hypothetical protein
MLDESVISWRPATVYSGSQQMKASLLNRLLRRMFECVLAAAISVLLSGCMTARQESDWRWKQYNPGYRDPIPANPDHPFQPGIF